jgi:urea transport system permease protein
MYRRPLDTLLVTVGVSLILRQAALQIFPSQGVPVEKPSWLDGQLTIDGYNWPLRQVFTILLAIACVAILAAWLKYTSFGRRIRATVQNRDLAETAGISTRTVDRLTFFVGSGLAGVAGVAASLIGGTNSQMGAQYIIPAFLVVAAGGIGQLKGTVIAALAVGVVLSCFASWTTGSLAQVLALVLVIVFLQVRPQGMFTVRTRSLV